MIKDEALKLALEALEMFCEHGAILRPIETRDAIKEALANEALEKMAENARELGLDYEPAQRKWVGLTNEEISALAWNFKVDSQVIRLVELEVMERNL